MINCIEVIGLKSIDILSIRCRKLNLFVGTNSSGKSTLLQALLLVSQNIYYNYGLNGPLTSIGDFRDARNYNIQEDYIAINLYDNNGKIELIITEDDNLQFFKPEELNQLKEKMKYGNNRIHYLSCDRIGSRDIYQKNLSNLNKVGISGEFSIDYLMQHGNDPLDKELIKYKESFMLLSQVNYWMKYIIGANIKVEDITGTDVVKAQYEMHSGKYIRPKNVGSGISYLISILTVCLGSSKEDVIIIENPEIHLHPLSQSRVCEFLYFIAHAGRQIFVETHSDHIFNALRVGIGNEKMLKEDITINFLELDDNHCTKNNVVEIGKRGRIMNPIPNLFDQFEADLDKMLGL